MRTNYEGQTITEQMFGTITFGPRQLNASGEYEYQVTDEYGQAHDAPWSQRVVDQVAARHPGIGAS